MIIINETISKNLKPLLECEMKNLVITHSPNVETDNFLSGEMDKYYFDSSAKIEILDGKLVITEHETNDGLCLELSKITEASPISKNDKLAFTQENVCALLYDEWQVITFYFD